MNIDQKAERVKDIQTELHWLRSKRSVISDGKKLKMDFVAYQEGRTYGDGQTVKLTGDIKTAISSMVIVHLDKVISNLESELEVLFG